MEGVAAGVAVGRGAGLWAQTDETMKRKTASRISEIINERTV